MKRISCRKGIGQCQNLCRRFGLADTMTQLINLNCTRDVLRLKSAGELLEEELAAFAQAHEDNLVY